MTEERKEPEIFVVPKGCWLRQYWGECFNEQCQQNTPLMVSGCFRFSPFRIDLQCQHYTGLPYEQH